MMTPMNMAVTETPLPKNNPARIDMITATTLFQLNLLINQRGKRQAAIAAMMMPIRLQIRDVNNAGSPPRDEELFNARVKKNMLAVPKSKSRMTVRIVETMDGALVMDKISWADFTQF
jgi:hypothetical protein